jgi:uncharacterized membrane protein
MAPVSSLYQQSIRPLLLPLPMGLWICSLGCDVIYRMGWGGPAWNDAALYALIGGFCSALLGAVPGYIDYQAISDPEVKEIAWWHTASHLIVIMLSGLNIWFRLWSEPGSGLTLALSILGIALLGISGWLGGELGYEDELAVEREQ